MLLTEAEFREIVAGRAVGGHWPYTGTEAEITKHLRRAIAELHATNLFAIDADFEHYGSGYASYVHVFCEKAKGRSRRHEQHVDVIDGLTIYLSRLTPFAIFGPEQRTQHAMGGTRHFVSSDTVYSTPTGDWSQEVLTVRRTLSSLGFVFPEREVLREKLPFDLVIPTVLDKRDAFDAIFYWED